MDEKELKNSMERFETKLRRYINMRDEAFSVKVRLESMLSEEEEKLEEEEAKEKELSDLVKKAEELKEDLGKIIPEIDDMLRRVRSTLDSIRALKRIKLVASVVGGFLIFLGGVFLLFGVFILMGFLKPFVSETIIRFIGWLVLAFGIISLVSGILHQIT